MCLLLDTQRLLYWQGMRNKLSVLVRELIETSQDPLYVSHASTIFPTLEISTVRREDSYRQSDA